MIKKGIGTYIAGDVNEIGQTDVTIGNYSSIAAEVTFSPTANHPSAFKPKMVNNFPPEKLGGEYQSITKSNFKIGNDVWIGLKAILMGGCEIGDGATVGAYSVVRGVVPPYSVVIGNPAKIIKFRFPLEKIDKLMKIKWWNWEEQQIRERLADFYDIDNFISKYESPYD